MSLLIDKTMTMQALKRRRYQPMLMIDLAVPRDIDSTISQMDDIYLYSVDDLQHVIAGNLEQRRRRPSMQSYSSASWWWRWSRLCGAQSRP